MRYPRLLHTISLLALVSLSTSAFSQSSIYFPKHTFGTGRFTPAPWYSQALVYLHEPSLLPLKQDQYAASYRFLWLRSFHQPVAVRIVVSGDGTGTVITKIGKGRMTEPTMPLRDDILPLSAAQVSSFTGKLQQDHFWSSASTGPVGGCDGAEWLIEAVAKGRYHAIARWSPSNGAAYDLGLLALQFAGIHVPEHEMY